MPCDFCARSSSVFGILELDFAQQITFEDDQLVEILALVLLHDEQAVLTAVELALEAGAPSKQTILNILSRLLEGEPVAPITSPQALALHVEPQANVGRYDSLRDREVHHAA